MSRQAALMFEVNDYEGVPVVLTRATWQAKAGNGELGSHPEIRSYLQDVKDTIESPHLVFQRTRDERSRIFYRLHIGRGDFAGKHLVVVIKYVHREESRHGFVSTMYLSRAVFSRGPVLWPRTEKTPQ